MINVKIQIKRSGRVDNLTLCVLYDNKWYKILVKTREECLELKAKHYDGFEEVFNMKHDIYKEAMEIARKYLLSGKDPLAKGIIVVIQGKPE